MARALFQQGQRVWVESVGAWASILRINPVWAKGFDEPVRVTYDVGLGREFQANELMVPVDDPMAATEDKWRLMRARNKWQTMEECPHHPFPGSYPIVVTDPSDWGGWRVPGAEYDRNPELIEYQARLIAAAPALKSLAERLVASVDEGVEDTSASTLAFAKSARELLQNINGLLTDGKSRVEPQQKAA